MTTPSLPLTAAQEVVHPTPVVRIAGDALYEFLGWQVLEFPGRRVVAQGLQGVVDRLDRGHEGLMALKADAHALGAQVIQVHDLGPGAAEDERHTKRRGDRLQLVAGLQADQEDGIDAGRLVGLIPSLVDNDP